MAIGRNTVEITKSEFEIACDDFAQALEEYYVSLEELEDEKRNRLRNRFTFR